MTLIIELPEELVNELNKLGIYTTSDLYEAFKHIEDYPPIIRQFKDFLESMMSDD